MWRANTDGITPRSAHRNKHLAASSSARLHPRGSQQAHPTHRLTWCWEETPLHFLHEDGRNALRAVRSTCTYPGPEADRSLGEGLRVTEAGNLAWQIQNKMCVYIFYTHTYISWDWSSQAFSAQDSDSKTPSPPTHRHTKKETYKVIY